ncbi:hypothetical protein Sjap_018321 [Stephania japonica]|uniref:Uncharacterized protein n=1 Tax=Stephania japonica TaxID=461633 RepID=A0AAP0NN13_9MAGN
MLIEALLHQISSPSLARSQIFSIRRCNGARPSPWTLRCLPRPPRRGFSSGGRCTFRDLNRRSGVRISVPLVLRRRASRDLLSSKLKKGMDWRISVEQFRQS